MSWEKLNQFFVLTDKLFLNQVGYLNIPPAGWLV